MVVVIEEDVHNLNLDNIFGKSETVSHKFSFVTFLKFSTGGSFSGCKAAGA
jgi:hypothetical protein